MTCKERFRHLPFARMRRISSFLPQELMANDIFKGLDRFRINKYVIKVVQTVDDSFREKTPAAACTVLPLFTWQTVVSSSPGLFTASTTWNEWHNKTPWCVNTLRKSHCSCCLQRKIESLKFVLHMAHGCFTSGVIL